MSFEGVASGNQFSPPSVSVLFAAAAPISEFEVSDVRVTGGALSDFAKQSDTQYRATLTVSDVGSGCGSVSIVIAEQFFSDWGRAERLQHPLRRVGHMPYSHCTSTKPHKFRRSVNTTGQSRAPQVPAQQS